MQPHQNYMDTLEANAVKPMGKAGASAIKHIEVMHHMTNGEKHSVLIPAHGMAAHMAGCAHCSGLPEGDAESAAGAAS